VSITLQLRGISPAPLTAAAGRAYGEHMASSREPQPVRRTVAACLGALVLLVSTGCAGAEAEFEPPIGKVEDETPMKALNLAMVTNGLGAARMVGTIVNKTGEPDRLVGVDLATERPFQVWVADAPVELPPGEPVRLAREAELTVFTDGLRPGFRADVTLVFRNSPPMETSVPVEPQTGPYAEVEVLRPPDGDISPDS
jgi:hypothetical protein